jgi:hypothetical protein
MLTAVNDLPMRVSSDPVDSSWLHDVRVLTYNSVFCIHMLPEAEVNESV